MIRLRTLGSVDLRAADGAQIPGVLRQPKRLALLIYLALGGPGFQRRDRILATFWPESDEKSARGALAQAVFQLRAALGKEVIVNRGDDEMAVDASALWCDVVAFEDALERGRPDEAMGVYAGELLPSFTLAESPGFEDWLADRRSALTGGAATACGELSLQAQEREDLRAALQWARRAVAIDRFSEPAHQRLIALLDHMGDRAAALRAFEDLRELLAAEFDAEPAAETIELIERVRTRAQSNGQAIAGSMPFRSAVTSTLSAPFRERRRILLAGISGALIIAALAWGAVAIRQPEPYTPPADHVAVLFFNDESPNHDLGYLAESLTSTLIDQLGQVRKLQVISQNGVRSFRDRSVRLDSIARQLDVGTLVGGSVTRSGDHLRVTVEMIDGATGIVRKSRRVERPNGELFALLDDISNEVSGFLRVAVGQEVKVREWRAQTRDVEAWRSLQQAEYLRGLATERAAAGEELEAASVLASADSLAERALSLDRHFVSALVSRGEIAEWRAWLSVTMEEPPAPDRWLRQAAEFANAAIAADMRSSAAFELRGTVAQAASLLGIGGPAASDSLLFAAEQDLRTAIRLGGERPRAESALSAVLYLQGKYKEARRVALRALEADAYLRDANQIANRLFQTSFEIGDDAEAGHWCDEVRRRMAGQWPAAWCDLMLLGWSQEGSHDPRKALHLLETFGPAETAPLRAAMAPRLTMLSAAVVARAGMKDSANAMLARARAAAPKDIELLHLEAAARIVMAEDERALSLLHDYLRQNPAARARIVNSRLFVRVRDRLSQDRRSLH